MNIADKKTLITIVVPVYNVEKYLYKCLESIRKQTLRQIEVICVNDGSTDNSLDIINQFVEIDDRFKVIDKKNTGYGDTVNCGIEAAKGTYVGIVESDDFVEPDMFEKLYMATNSETIDIVKANYNFYRENSMPHFQYNEILRQAKYNENFIPMENVNIFEVPASVWSAIYRKKFLKDNNIKFNTTPGASYQDVSFTFRVFMKAKSMICLKDAVINYRFDNPDASVKNPKKIYCICDEFNSIKEDVEQENNNIMWNVYQHVKFQDYIWNYNRLSGAYQYCFLIQINNEFKDIMEKIDKKYWMDNEWNELQEITFDHDMYFERTSKVLINEKLKRLPVINNSYDIDGFKNTIRLYNSIYIYGAGVVGGEIYKYLKNNEFVWKIKGFITSSITNEKSLYGLEIYNINHVTIKENEMIILAVSGKSQMDILCNMCQELLQRTMVITDDIRQGLK